MKNECLIEYDRIGEDVYYNICTGEENTVPWGVSHSIAFILILIGLVCFLLVFGKLIKDYIIK